MDNLSTFELLTLASIIGVYVKLTQEVHKLKSRVVALEKTEGEVKAHAQRAPHGRAGDQATPRREGHPMRYFTLDEFDSPDLPGSGRLCIRSFLTSSMRLVTWLRCPSL